LTDGEKTLDEHIFYYAQGLAFVLDAMILGAVFMMMS
jgi:energy-converting hydrogenase Eha subunit F